MARTIPQAAAIPFRESNGALDVLLIRWIEEDKWGVPKGLIDPGNSAKETAEIESMEEAGISGDLLERRLGNSPIPNTAVHAVSKFSRYAYRRNTLPTTRPVIVSENGFGWTTP